MTELDQKLSIIEIAHAVATLRNIARHADNPAMIERILTGISKVGREAQITRRRIRTAIKNSN